MMLDIAFAVLFTGVMFRANKAAITCIFVITAASHEVFSALPFGVLSFFMAISILAIKKLSNIFDEASIISSSVVFLAGLSLYFFITAVARFWLLGGNIFEHSVRIGMQYGRSVLFISVFICFVSVIRFGINYIRYAFLEKKVIQF